ncbi:MAG TPA: hypothetical protein VKR56_10030 [Candidatus Cybelea sp.]|nr:hypothetical protein [Candidatus Cybelea sp.]
MRSHFKTLAAALAVAGLSACGNANGFTTPPGAATAAVTRNSASLGPVLSTSDGGEIFGFDVDQKGNDGVLASASLTDISVQTFDATSGKITKTLGELTGAPVARGDDYVADGIFDGDVGLVDFQKAGKPGQTPTKDMYHLLDPVTKGRFTGRWIPTVKLFNILQWAPNQSTTTAVVFGYQREGSDPSELLVSDVAKGTFGKVITLDPNQFSLGTQPQLAQDTVHNLAVMASSPSYGAAGGPPPVITTIDLHSGKLKQFSGVQCPGSVGCGYANGIGYDSATGVACTTTELDGGLEFYDLAKGTGTHELLPNGGGQYYAGAFVASDPVNKLFLVAQPISSTSGSGSSIQVYEEDGTLLESINGFGFAYAGDFVIPVRISINSTARTGWVNGPGSNQLQEFSY